MDFSSHRNGFRPGYLSCSLQPTRTRSTQKAESVPSLVKPKRGEARDVFSFIMFKSRVHRDTVNAKVMKDTRLAKMVDSVAMPFDSKRMAYGGFKVLVGA